MSIAHKVPVGLGSRSYDIAIGTDLIGSAADLIAPHLSSNKIVIVTDETVAGLYKDKINLGGLDAKWVILPPGEAQKSFDTLQHVLDAMFEHGLSRNDTIIAFGGGVMGDLTGFAASVYKRGCRFIQIPTTLLAQVDSSVGGKTAINVKYGKNLVGAFYQPRLVIADMSVLQTLNTRQVKAGYAEVLKYGLLGDRVFFDWLEENGEDVIALSDAAIAYAVKVSCETKARIVAADEHERGKRALLNLGHTFGHALEAEAGYGGDLLHGEAVSAGMEMAFNYCARNEMCSQGAANLVSAHLKQTKLTRITDVKHLLADPAKLLAHMQQDKKNEAGDLTLILAHDIGNAFVAKGPSQGAAHEQVSDYLTHLSLKYGSPS
ncbi:MAG: 3-dehydroquinate synthase [Maricaulaceae bacterium]